MNKTWKQADKKIHLSLTQASLHKLYNINHKKKYIDVKYN